MDMEYNTGVMEVSMLESGEITKPMAKVFSIMQTEMCMKGNGKKIKLMEKGSINIRTGQNTRDSGSMTSSMGSEYKSGLMGRGTREATRMEPKQERDS
jgi:hypothetical protein